MTAPNTIPNEEYAQRMFEACRRMSKRLSNVAFEEDCKCRKFDNKGADERALLHYFNSKALQLAITALAKAPEELAK